MIELPFEIGALYHRQREVHALLGGQRQGGISTPKDVPVVIIFTGEAGKAHGYDDEWDDDNVFHYVGEGQRGDMTYTGGNRAILRHDVEGKKLILFQSMGKGQSYRYLGEHRYLGSYERPNVRDSNGTLRKAIVFQLLPVETNHLPIGSAIREVPPSSVSLEGTVGLHLTEVRKKQSLFRRRLVRVEKACRLTGIRDLRFLRASHIKPWASCASGEERVDGSNGLLLTPHADLLFDRGWITFEEKGRLVASDQLPKDVAQRIGLKLSSGRVCGSFSEKQQGYLEFHRNKIFDRKFKKQVDPVADLLEEITD